MAHKCNEDIVTGHTLSGLDNVEVGRQQLYTANLTDTYRGGSWFRRESVLRGVNGQDVRAKLAEQCCSQYCAPRCSQSACFQSETTQQMLTRFGVIHWFGLIMLINEITTERRTLVYFRFLLVVFLNTLFHNLLLHC
jgi:hypothetical protein